MIGGRCVILQLALWCASRYTPSIAGAQAAIMVRKCIKCKVKASYHGLLDDGKILWCGACAPAGSVDMVSKKCEDCGLRQPSFGLASEGKKKRWCGSCAGQHEGSISVIGKKCEVRPAPPAAWRACCRRSNAAVLFTCRTAK